MEDSHTPQLSGGLTHTTAEWRDSHTPQPSGGTHTHHSRVEDSHTPQLSGGTHKLPYISCTNYQAALTLTKLLTQDECMLQSVAGMAGCVILQGMEVKNSWPKGFTLKLTGGTHS